MSLQYASKIAANTEFINKLDVMRDPKIMNQLAIITDELETAKNLEESIKANSEKLIILKEFARNTTEEILSKEINELNKSFADMKIKNEEAIVKIKKRHEMSILATKLRAERIINAAER